LSASLARRRNLDFWELVPGGYFVRFFARSAVLIIAVRQEMNLIALWKACQKE
jgi:hypothetical protein